MNLKYNLIISGISIIIVVVFIICHFPRMIPNIAEMAGVNTSKYDIFTVILSINHLLLTINSSVNYIIYLLLCGRGRHNSRGNYYLVMGPGLGPGPARGPCFLEGPEPDFWERAGKFELFDCCTLVKFKGLSRPEARHSWKGSSPGPARLSKPGPGSYF